MRRRNSRQQQKINTSALPDIIFMILFFFMVVGKVPAPISQIDDTVTVTQGGDELKKTGEYIHVRIGYKDGEIVAQVGYKVYKISELSGAIKGQKGSIVILHIDEDISSGYVEYVIKPAVVKAGIKKLAKVTEDVEI